MDIQEDIKWIHRELDHVKDTTLIAAIKNILQYHRSTSSRDHISIEQYNKELEYSEKEIEAGNYYTVEEAREKVAQWGKK